MLTAVLISFGVVFLAELPDKSQLMTMTYALRYHWWVVLCGAATAAFLVHGLSVTIGHFLGLTLPHRPLTLAAGFAFLGFAVWTWRESRKDASAIGAVARPRFVLLTVISAYLLAELGDMTMFASVALAANHDWLGVWIGATAAMVAANGLAIAMASALHKRLPTGLLHLMASLLFLVFGLWLVLDTALGLHPLAIGVTAASAIGALSAAAVATMRRRCRPVSIRGPVKHI